MTPPLLFLTAFLFTLVALILHARTGHIPNVLTFGLLVLALGLAWRAGTLAEHLSASVLGLAVGAPLFQHEWLGGGILKLLVALLALLGLKLGAVLSGSVVLVFVVEWGYLFLRDRDSPPSNITGPPVVLVALCLTLLAWRLAPGKFAS